VNTRDKILAAITAGKPQPVIIPEKMLSQEKKQSALVSEFIEMVGTIGGRVIQTGDYKMIQKDLADSISSGRRSVNTVPAIGSMDKIDTSYTATDLASIDRAYLKSSMAVAENGAVWLTETDMTNRLLPFICQHLVIVLEMKDIVSNMHDAYKRIQGNQEAYHLFLAGPSKTADIEQSLVIGAHGARSLLVYLISDYPVLVTG